MCAPLADFRWRMGHFLDFVYLCWIFEKIIPSRCLEVALGNERFPINYLHSVVPRNASDRYNWKEHIKYDSGNLTVNSSRGCRGSLSIDRGNQRNDAFPGQSIALDDWGLYNAEVTEVTMLYLWLPTGNWQLATTNQQMYESIFTHTRLVAPILFLESEIGGHAVSDPKLHAFCPLCVCFLVCDLWHPTAFGSYVLELGLIDIIRPTALIWIWVFAMYWMLWNGMDWKSCARAGPLLHIDFVEMSIETLVKCHSTGGVDRGRDKLRLWAWSGKTFALAILWLHFNLTLIGECCWLLLLLLLLRLHFHSFACGRQSTSSWHLSRSLSLGTLREKLAIES